MRQLALVTALTLYACSPQNQPESENLDTNLVSTDLNLVESTSSTSGRPSTTDAAGRQREARAETPAPRSSGIPSYDYVSYCERIGETAGGSYQIEATCRQMETEARNEARSMTIPARIMNYCDDIGQTAGGSYQIFKTCVEMESEAASGL